MDGRYIRLELTKNLLDDIKEISGVIETLNKTNTNYINIFKFSSEYNMLINIERLTNSATIEQFPILKEMVTNIQNSIRLKMKE